MGLKSKSSGRASVNMQANGQTHTDVEKIFPYPVEGDGTPASRVSIAVSARRSENYQSVSIEVRVEVPCYPGQEIAAGKFCSDKCAVLMQDNEGDLDSLLSSLS